MYLANNQLFQIQNEYLQLLGKIEEAEGELTPEIDQALQFTEKRLNAEAGYVGQMIKMLEYWTDNVDQEINRLEKVKARATKSKEMLKSRLSAAMQQFGIERIVNDTITISFRKSEAVEITDAKLIPEDFIHQQPYFNKTLIKEAIKAGTDVPGAELVQRQNLQIK